MSKPKFIDDSPVKVSTQLQVFKDSREVLEDVVSHYKPFCDALTRCYKSALGSDDISYWSHELAVLARMYIKAQSLLDSIHSAEKKL